MTKQDNDYAKGEGYPTADPNNGAAASSPVKSETAHEEKILILLNRIYRETRTTRSWVAFVGIVMLISMLLAILGFFYNTGEM
jgi:hypothetical protein